MSPLPDHLGIWGELAAVEHELRFVDVVGVRTRVLRAGTGPDLVLLHGTSGHLEAYARDIAGLAADFRVTAYDMVGRGWSLYDGLTRAGFDLSLSYALTIDHGLVQSYEMVCGGTETPLVPIVVNTAAPPLPTMERCVGFGRALGDALRADGDAGQVLVIASGGLSHWLPTNDPRDPAMAEDRRHAVIHGREAPRAFSVEREHRVRAMGGDPHAHVNGAWDRWFLQQLGTEDPGAITALGDDGLEKQAGSGGQEIRTWLIGHSAVRAPLVWTAYEPVPEWITGMGLSATFEVR